MWTVFDLPLIFIVLVCPPHHGSLVGSIYLATLFVRAFFIIRYFHLRGKQNVRAAKQHLLDQPLNDFGYLIIKHGDFFWRIYCRTDYPSSINHSYK